MEQVGVRELRDHLSWYLKKVKAGKELAVADRGRIIARMVPAESRGIATELAALVRDGTASWGGGKPKGARKPVVLPGRSVADLVIAERR